MSGRGPLHAGEPVEIAVLRPPPGSYCHARVSIEAAEAAGPPQPDVIVARSLTLDSRWERGTERGAFLARGVAAQTLDVPILDASGAPVAMELSGDRPTAELELTVDIGAALREQSVIGADSLVLGDALVSSLGAALSVRLVE